MQLIQKETVWKFSYYLNCSSSFLPGYGSSQVGQSQCLLKNKHKWRFNSNKPTNPTKIQFISQKIQIKVPTNKYS